MKTYTFYGQNENEQPEALLNVNGKVADQVIDVLFGYVVASYDYLFDDIFAEEEGRKRVRGLK